MTQKWPENDFKITQNWFLKMILKWHEMTWKWLENDSKMTGNNYLKMTFEGKSQVDAGDDVQLSYEPISGRRNSKEMIFKKTSTLVSSMGTISSGPQKMSDDLATSPSLYVTMSVSSTNWLFSVETLATSSLSGSLRACSRYELRFSSSVVLAGGCRIWFLISSNSSEKLTNQIVWNVKFKC